MSNKSKVKNQTTKEIRDEFINQYHYMIFHPELEKRKREAYIRFLELKLQSKNK